MNSRSSDPQSWIHEYLDGTLSESDFSELNTWIRSAPGNARLFAAAVLLDDRLRSELAASGIDSTVDRAGLSVSENFEPAILVKCADAGSENAAAGTATRTAGVTTSRTTRRKSIRTLVSLAVTLALVIIGPGLFWQNFSGTRATADVSELQRLIEKNEITSDRTYRIDVEFAAAPPKKRGRWQPDDIKRPKVSLDQAALFVREGGQFVLVRNLVEGSFVTGCNLQQSWMISTDGTVRTNSDRAHFNRDVPGHEHQLSLVDIHLALSQLQQAYDVEVLPEEPAAENDVGTRLMVAVRHRRERGPRRVEISYEIESGLIRQMRFVEMPFGPEVLTVRMTLVSEDSLDADFFEPEFHSHTLRSIEEK